MATNIYDTIPGDTAVADAHEPKVNVYDTIPDEPAPVTPRRTQNVYDSIPVESPSTVQSPPDLLGRNSTIKNNLPDFQATTRGGAPISLPEGALQSSLGELSSTAAEELNSEGVSIPNLVPSMDTYRHLTLDPFSQNYDETQKYISQVPASTPEKLVLGGAQGLNDLASGVTQFFTSPKGIAQLGIAATPLAPAVYAKWAYDMGKAGIGSVEEAWNDFKKSDWQSFGKDTVSAFGAFLGAKAAAGHGAGLLSKQAIGYAPMGIGESPRPLIERTQSANSIQSPVENVRGEAPGITAQMAEGNPGEVQQPAGTQAAPSGTADVPVVEPKPIEATEAIDNNNLTLIVDYSEADLARYKELKAEQDKMDSENRILDSQKNFTPEWKSNQYEFEKLRNKYNGNKPKQIVEAKEKQIGSENAVTIEEPLTRTYDRLKAKKEAGNLTDPVEIAQLEKIEARQKAAHGKEAFADAIAQLKANAEKIKAEKSTPTPAAETGEKGKQPWEMTREEYANEADAHRREWIDYNNNRIKSIRESRKQSNATSDRLGIKRTSGDASEITKLKESNRKHEAAMGKPYSNDTLDREHKYAVEQALREGKPVPPEVLADYPDLKPPPAATGATGKSSTDQGTGTAPPPVNIPPVVGAEAVPPVKPEVHDWTSATDESHPSTPISPTKPKTGGPDIVEYHAGVPLPKFPNRKMSEVDRVTTSRSAKLQKSFDESRRAQKEVNRVIPNKQRQGAASVYREANGDMALLKQWETNAKQKWMRDFARIAQTLTPAEIAIVNKAKAAFDILEARGNAYDVLKSHRDNYIPHVWDVKQPGMGFGFGGGMLKQRFRFSKARTFDTFFDGDQAGFKPKNVALGDLLPTYIHELNRTIADRQMVQELSKGVNSKGEPLVVPRGISKVVDGPEGQAVLVTPKTSKDVDTSHYRVMENQPALSNWTWSGKDTDGNPIFMKSDLAVHPDVYRRLNSILGQSAFKTWYRDQTGGMSQIPKAIAKGIDVAQSAMKREMFGFLAPFHQVQEGTHAIGHAVNPFFGVPKVNLRDAGQMDAARHGLMLLPDRTTGGHYLEGVGAQSSLLSKGLRKTGKAGAAVSDVIDGYQDYLFHQYIPGLKYKTYQAILERNLKRYQPEIASGELTPADVKTLSAEQSNAAYGHLNYALLDRNPTMQHLAQLTLLAPDFLEARGRFVGQAVKGLSSKVGTEQLRAVATLAVAQAGSAFVLSQLLGTDYDPKHPFEVIYKGRRYAMRSVPEDLFGLLKDTRQFAYSRVNPLTVKTGIQLATGLNYRGEKTTATDTMTELLAGYIPITARSIPGLRSLTEASRNNPVSPLQQLAGSLGLRISRYSPVSETYKLAGAWMDEQKMSRDKGSYPISKYQQLRYALEDGDIDRAQTAYGELKKTMTPTKILDGFKESVNHPFTGAKATDAKFAASLKGYDKELYNHALKTRQNILHSFSAIKQK